MVWHVFHRGSAGGVQLDWTAHRCCDFRQDDRFQSNRPPETSAHTIGIFLAAFEEAWRAFLVASGGFSAVGSSKEDYRHRDWRFPVLWHRDREYGSYCAS